MKMHPRFVSIVAGLSLGTTVQAQNLPIQIAERHLSDINAVAHTARSNDKSWSDTLIDTPELSNAVLDYAIIYGDMTWKMGETRLANDAARVHIKLTFADYPNYKWPARIDFLQRDGEWSLYQTRLMTLRPLGADASPDQVLQSFLEGITRYSGELATAGNDKTVRLTKLHQAWGMGAGYWGLAPECLPPDRASGCSPYPSGNISIFAKMVAWGETGQFRISDVRPDGKEFKALLSASKKRRTYTEKANWQLRLSKHYRHGWQLTGSKIEKRAEPAPVNLGSVNSETKTKFIREILKGFFGADRPEPGNIMAYSKKAEVHFAKTRTGRQALARLISSTAMIGETSAEDWIISSTDSGRLKATRKDRNLRPKSLIFDVTGEPGSFKISTLEINL